MQLNGMTKLIYSSSFDSSVDVRMDIVEDPKLLIKSAGTVFDCDYDELMPDDEHVGIHLVALGDFERYGSNRNGDGFPKKACIGYHSTFVKNGNLYRHHRNKDPEKRLGTVVKSAYNAPMGRVELFIHAHKENAHDELERLEKSGEIPFSMACVAAGTLVCTLRGYIPIEHVKVGDRVLTHTGQWQKVNTIMDRDSDHYYEVSFVSWGRTAVKITAEHPWYAACFEDIPGRYQPEKLTNSPYRKAHKQDLYKYLKWTSTEALTDRHYVAVPLCNYDDLEASLDKMRIYGYYMAEGSLSARNGDKYSTVLFCCNVDDCAVEELITLSGSVASVRPHRESEHACVVQWCNTVLAEEIDCVLGHGASKHVPEQLFHASPELVLAFVGAWFNGDGWQDKNGLHWSMSKHDRAIELQRLLGTLAIPASCNRIDHPYDRGIVKSVDAVEYVVNVSNQFSDLFAPVSKAGILNIAGDTKTRTFISGDYLMVPVNAVHRVDTQIKVYNLAVDEDESYTVYGLSVHNCKVAFDRCNVCNTIRRTSKDPNQCDHVRFNLGKMAEDGKIICTHNDEPNFFDISFVGRPADRIAWNLKIAAGEVVDSIKLAEAEGVWVPDHIIITSRDALEKLALLKNLAEFETQYIKWAEFSPETSTDRYFWELRKAAVDKLSDEQIEQIRTKEPKDVFYTLAKAGVVMDSDSFFKYAFGQDYGEIKQYMPGVRKAVRTVFNDMLKRGECQRACNDSAYDVVDTNQDLSSTIVFAKIGHDLSLTNGRVDERVIEHTAIRHTNVKISVDKDEKIASNSSSNDELFAVLAEKYAAYKLSALSAIQKIHCKTDTNTLFAIATAQNLI